MNKAQIKILQEAEKIFLESKSRVHLTWRKAGGLTCCFDLVIDGVKKTTMMTNEAHAFVEGWDGARQAGLSAPKGVSSPELWAAMEYGFRCCEKGMNLEAAKQSFSLI